MVTTLGLDDVRAETIVELFNQLAAQGYTADDLRIVHDAYELAAPLYTCHYRSSGRSLTHHAVGTASIIAALASPTELVAAMLLHAVYAHGDYGTHLRRITAERRAQMRQAAGAAAEDIVYRYTSFRWNETTVPVIAEGLATFDAAQRQSVLMRLADQLDIYGTRDALYCNNPSQRHDVARRHGPRIVAMAETLRYPALAAALARAYREFSDLTAPPALTSPVPRDGIMTSPSYRIRPSIAVYQRVRRAVWRKVGR